MLPLPEVMKALGHGVRMRCPHCGAAPSLHHYVKVVPECPACGEKLSHYKADDLPAYLTIFLTGHIMVAVMILSETMLHPGDIAYAAYPLTALLLVLGLLPRIKGMVLAWMWCLYRDSAQAEI